MLALLLDENVSQEIALQIRTKRPDISVTSVHFWQDGRFKARPDKLILGAAAEEGLTLVTYDQKTIVPVLIEWGHAGTDHAGVIFIDNLTIAPSDFGTIIRSLIDLWDSSHDQTWTNLVTYLKASR